MTVSLATLPPQIQQRYNAKLLSTPERNLIHNLAATPVMLPDNMGFIDRQSRYDRLDLFPVPLDWMHKTIHRLKALIEWMLIVE